MDGFAVNPAITLGSDARFLDVPGGFNFPAGSTSPGDPRAALIGPNFQFQVVPEPGTLTLAALGAAILAATLRRRGKTL